MQITTLFNQSVAESCQLVSSLSAYEQLYFDLELFESDLPLQFLSYLDLTLLVFLLLGLNPKSRKMRICCDILDSLGLIPWGLCRQIVINAPFR